MFSAEECERIVALGESLAAVDAGVEKGENRYRVGRISWIEPNDDAAWIFHRLGLAFLEANRDYGFELIGFADALQYTVYGPGERFDWHMDLGPGRTSARKLSMTVQLSPQDDYAGGDLEFVGNTHAAERERGSATIFPAYVGHRVSRSRARHAALARRLGLRAVVSLADVAARRRLSSRRSSSRRRESSRKSASRG